MPCSPRSPSLVHSCRELVGPVDFRCQRRDLVGGEAAHRGPELVGGLAEVEVERREIVGDHRLRLLPNVPG